MKIEFQEKIPDIAIATPDMSTYVLVMIDIPLLTANVIMGIIITDVVTRYDILKEALQALSLLILWE